MTSFFITGSNQPPRFLNYFFSTYLLIYEDMPVGESPVRWIAHTCQTRVQKFSFCYFKKVKSQKFLEFRQKYFCYLHAALMSTNQYFASHCPMEPPSLTFTHYFNPLTLSCVTAVGPFFAAPALVEFDSCWIHYVAFNPYLCFLLLAGCCDWQGNLEMSGSSSSPRVSLTWN